MQLLLVDTADAKMSKTQGIYGDLFSFHLKVNCEDLGAKEDEDVDIDVTRDLLLEVTKGGKRHSLTVILQPLGDGDYDLLVYSGIKTSNVLYNLWKRFEDEVMISVEINSVNVRKPGGEVEVDGNGCGFVNHCCVSSKGMLIKKESCRAPSAYMKKFDSDELEKGSLFQVKVTAHICEQNDLRKTTGKILEDGLASDVVITAANGIQIRSHRNFLISTSSVLRKMLESDMRESKEGHIDMTDISEKGIRAFLRYLYQGDIIGPEQDLDVAYDLLYAAHKYDVPKLEAMMKTYLVDKANYEFSANLAFKIYSFVRGIENASELTEKVVQIMHTKFDELKELPEFKEVFQKNPKDALEFCGYLAKFSSPSKRKLDSEDGDDTNTPKK